MFGLWLCQRPTSWGSAMLTQVWPLLSPCGAAVRMFAPSEPTRFGSAMKIYKYIFAALTSLTFHVKHTIASVATKYLYFGITGHEHVGTLAFPKSQYDTKCQGDGCIFNYRTFSGRLSMCSGCFSLIAAILLVSLFIMWY